MRKRSIPAHLLGDAGQDPLKPGAVQVPRGLGLHLGRCARNTWKVSPPHSCWNQLSPGQSGSRAPSLVQLPASCAFQALFHWLQRTHQFPLTIPHRLQGQRVRTLPANMPFIKWTRLPSQHLPASCPAMASHLATCMKQTRCLLPEGPFPPPLPGVPALSAAAYLWFLLTHSGVSENTQSVSIDRKRKIAFSSAQKESSTYLKSWHLSVFSREVQGCFKECIHQMTNE